MANIFPYKLICRRCKAAFVIRLILHDFAHGKAVRCPYCKEEYTLTPEALKKIRISFQEFTDKAPEE